MDKKMLSFSMMLSIIFCLGVLFCYAQEGSMPMGAKEPTEESQSVEPQEKTVEPSEEMEMDLTIAEAQCGTGVENRVIVGEATSFSPSVEKVYCATFVKGAISPTTIKHVWYYKDQKMSEVPLDIKYASFHTWSYKTILPEWVGTWRVEVLDAKDKVLKIIGFEIAESVAEPATKPVEEKIQPEESQQTEGATENTQEPQE